MTVKVVAIALIGALVGVLLRECGFRGSAVFSATAAAVALTVAVSSASEILSLATERSVTAGVAEAGEVALKLFGIAAFFADLHLHDFGLGEIEIMFFLAFNAIVIGVSKSLLIHSFLLLSIQKKRSEKEGPPALNPEYGPK